MMLDITWKKGTENEYSCGHCTQRYSDKVQPISHITIQHIKCTVCDKIFPTGKELETHIKAVHKQGKSKHSLAREPSFKNHKNKKYI